MTSEWSAMHQKLIYVVGAVVWSNCSCVTLFARVWLLLKVLKVNCEVSSSNSQLSPLLVSLKSLKNCLGLISQRI